MMNRPFSVGCAIRVTCAVARKSARGGREITRPYPLWGVRVPGFRLTVVTALGAAGILTALACAPAMATDAPPAISISYAGADGNQDPYNLTVIADDANGVVLQSMTAHVYSASNQDVADVPMSPVSTSNTASQTWQATTPIPESALPAGTYTVTVDASDGSETDTGLTAPAAFSFQYVSSHLAVVANPPTVTQGSQSVTFSGTLTGTAPGGTPVTIPNAAVSVSASGGAATAVGTTDANGQFTDIVTGITQTGDYNFSVPGTDSYPSASQDVTVSAVAATTSMTVSASPATVTEGIQTVTFSGNVSASYTPPAPAAPVTVNIGSGVPVYLNGTQVTTTDDAQGDFTYTSPGTAPGGYTFSIQPTSLYQGASYQVNVGSQQAPATMTVTPSQPNVTFGSTSVTFTGSVTADPQGASAQGIGSGVPVYLSVGGAAASQVTTTTDANGDFSYTASGIAGGTDYAFSVNPTALYTGASYDVKVPVVQGATNLTVTATPPDGDLSAKKITYSGTASVTPAGSTTQAGIGSGVPVYLSINGGPAVQVTTTTDASGDFSYTAGGPSDPADYNFEIQAGTFYTAASDDVPLGPALESNLTVTPDISNVTEGSQQVTFKGNLTGQAPGSSAQNAIQGAPVLLSINGGTPAQVGTTDSSGDFTYTGSAISATTVYTFSVALKPPSQTGESYTAATAAVAIGVAPAPTRITDITTGPPHLKYGQSATLTGTVQYQGPGPSNWLPLPGAMISLQETKTTLTSVTAGPKGTFTATLPTTHGPGWTATVSATGLTQQSAATGNLRFAVPMKVRAFSAKLGVSGKVNLAGCLQVTAPVGYGPQTTVRIQYAARRGGRWSTLGTIALHNHAGTDRSCLSSDESYFRGSLRAALDNAYYRANFVATSSFQGATSNLVHAWKYPTRIVSFSVSPQSLAAGQLVTIKARLQIKTSAHWRAWAGQPVSVIYNDKGTTYWYSFHSHTTNAAGWVTFVQEGGGSNFVAVTYADYTGDRTHLASRSRGVAVTNHGPATSAGVVPAGASVSNSALAVAAAPPVVRTLHRPVPCARPGRPAVERPDGGQLGGPVAYPAAQAGGRLARNAAMPSAASGESNSRADNSASSAARASKPLSSSGVSNALVSRKPCGDAARSASSTAVVPASMSSTASVISPMAAAAGASKVSPVR